MKFTLQNLIHRHAAGRTPSDLEQLAKRSRKKLSRELIRRIMEEGHPGKLVTIRALAEVLDLGEAEWVEVLVAWTESVLGEHASLVAVSPKERTPVRIKTEENSVIARLTDSFAALGHRQQTELLKAMQHTEIMDMVASLNHFHDSVVDQTMEFVRLKLTK